MIEGKGKKIYVDGCSWCRIWCNDRNHWSKYGRKEYLKQR